MKSLEEKRVLGEKMIRRITSVVLMFACLCVMLTTELWLGPLVGAYIAGYIWE